MFPWQENQDFKYLVMDISNNTVIEFCCSEEEATRKAISEAFGNNKRIEVFVATGFSTWKEKLIQY